MEWQVLHEILITNAKQAPAVVGLVIIIVVLWKNLRDERKENKRLNQSFQNYLKSLVKPDDDSSDS